MQKKFFKESLLVLALPIILWSGSLKADVPRVVADIVPIHSLVSMVMDGLSEPQLLIPQNVSPHDYSMRPSEAKALQEASLVVYLGHDMTPWLEPLFETIAASADALDLSEVKGVLKLPYRDGPIFDDHTDHDEYEEETHADHEEKGHDEYEEETHADHEEESNDASAFEWAGVFSVDDSSHTWLMQKVGGEYADPTMRLVLLPTDSLNEETMHALEEIAETLITGESCTVIEDGESMAPSAEGSCFELHVGNGDDSKFIINTSGLSGLTAYAQHVPTEFERDQHYMKNSVGIDIDPVAQKGVDGHDHHHHGESDPHMWLDPDNAVIWLNVIASRLGRIDPTNADRYTANAKSAIQQIKYTTHKIEDQLASIQGNRFIVYHDAYHYFEKRFGVTAAGSISLGDASKPSPKRLRQLKNLFEDGQINCVLSEPQYSSKLIDSVFAGYKPYIGSVDPVGIDLKLGPALYSELLENIAFDIAQCVNH